MEKRFCGKNRAEMNLVLNTMCDIEDRFELTKEELDAFDIAIQCVTQVLNRMTDERPISWDD